MVEKMEAGYLFKNTFGTRLSKQKKMDMVIIRDGMVRAVT